MSSTNLNPLDPDSLCELKQIALPTTFEPSGVRPIFLAKLSCGLFGISEDEIEDYQSLDSLFIKNRFNTFFFKAAGDSMEPTIYAGQILVVDRSKKNFNGKVCAVAFEDKIICKRVILKNDLIILRSDNSKYKDIVIQNNENVNFWGVVTAIAGFIE
jgi:DNA polymerase V